MSSSWFVFLLSWSVWYGGTRYTVVGMESSNWPKYAFRNPGPGSLGLRSQVPNCEGFVARVDWIAGMDVVRGYLFPVILFFGNTAPF